MLVLLSYVCFQFSAEGVHKLCLVFSGVNVRCASSDSGWGTLFLEY